MQIEWRNTHTLSLNTQHNHYGKRKKKMEIYSRVFLQLFLRAHEKKHLYEISRETDQQYDNEMVICDESLHEHFSHFSFIIIVVIDECAAPLTFINTSTFRKGFLLQFCHFSLDAITFSITLADGIA